MTIRNLDYLFKAKSIAVIGASAREDTVGHTVTKNLLNGDFTGNIWLVNPKHQQLLGHPVFHRIGQLPDSPDLAVIATPPATVPGIIEELGELGTRAVIVISSGFAEIGPKGAALQQSVLEAARPHLLRVLGPNCLGALAPHIGMNASFAHLSATPGHIAFITQSGAVIASVLDWAQAREIGFSQLVSLGNSADMDFGDMLDYLASDSSTTSILLYMESITHARKFMSAARAAARMKPVLVVKSGRFAESATAACSHTGAMAGSDAVYDAAFRRAGMVRVSGLKDLFEAASILNRIQKIEGERVAIVTNGGGFGVMATDELIAQGGTLASLSPDTITALNKVLPPTWSAANPMDIIGDASGDRYQAALSILFTDPNVDIVIVLYCPTAISNSTEVAEAIVSTKRSRGNPHLLAAFVGDATVSEARHICTSHGIPCYDTPESAVSGVMYLVNHARNQFTLMQTPPSMPENFSPDVIRARQIVDTVLHERREWLNNQESRAMLAAYGIPSVDMRLAATPAEAARYAAHFAGPIALKINSKDILHKSDIGGVALNVETVMVEQAATEMLKRIAATVPDAQLDGFVIEPMITHRGAFELLLGASEDSQFGPIVMFGQGGTGTEQIADTAIGIPPLNLHLAQEVMSRTRVYRLLQGYRDQPPAAVDLVKLALVRVSQLVADFAEIKELDINPLLVDSNSITALDVRIRIAESKQPPEERLAIRPYPKELEEVLDLPTGIRMILRPIRPEDEPALQRAFKTLSPEDIRLRFMVSMSSLSHVMAARFTQLDYDRDMALVLSDERPCGAADIHGVVRINADPDNECAEFAIIIQRELTGLGLGIFLMQRIIDHARNRGLREIYGLILRDNHSMLEICKALGFSQHACEDDLGLVKATLTLEYRKH